MQAEFKNTTDLAIRLVEIDTALRALSAQVRQAEPGALDALDAEIERNLDARDALIDEIDAAPLLTVADAAAKLAAFRSIQPEFFDDDFATDGRLMRRIAAGLASLRSA